MKHIQPSLTRIEHSLNHRLWPWTVLPIDHGLGGDLYCAWADCQTKVPPFATYRVGPIADALQDNLIQSVQLLAPLNHSYHYITVADVRYSLIDWDSRRYRFTADFRLY